jgi:hypothetical protein
VLAIDCNGVAPFASPFSRERVRVRVASEHAAIPNPLTSILSPFERGEADKCIGV